MIELIRTIEPSAALAHEREGRPDRVVDAREVDARHGIPVPVRHLVEEAVAGDARVGHDSVERPELALHLLDRALHLAGVGHVGVDGERAVLVLLLAAVREGHDRAERLEQLERSCARSRDFRRSRGSPCPRAPAGPSAPPPVSPQWGFRSSRRPPRSSRRPLPSSSSSSAQPRSSSHSEIVGGRVFCTLPLTYMPMWPTGKERTV